MSLEDHLMELDEDTFEDEFKSYLETEGENTFLYNLLKEIISENKLWALEIVVNNLRSILVKRFLENLKSENVFIPDNMKRYLINNGNLNVISLPELWTYLTRSSDEPFTTENRLIADELNRINENTFHELLNRRIFNLDTNREQMKLVITTLFRRSIRQNKLWAIKILIPKMNLYGPTVVKDTVEHFCSQNTAFSEEIKTYFREKLANSVQLQRCLRPANRGLMNAVRNIVSRQTVPQEQKTDILEGSEDDEETIQINIERSCRETSSLIGDDLKDINNITIFVNENSRIKGECLLTSEWKAHVDRFTGHEALTFYPPQLNNNAEKKVFKLPYSGVWINSSKELLLMFNTFYLKSIGRKKIGSSFGVSRLHGAEEEIFEPIPISRRDFNEGIYTIKSSILTEELDLTKPNREKYKDHVFKIKDNGKFDVYKLTKL